PVLEATATGSWQELVYMNEAMVDPMNAYKKMKELPADKLGSSSRSSLLHWAATRPGWLPARGRCSDNIVLDDPNEPYPHCVPLRQLVVTVDPSARNIGLT